MPIAMKLFDESRRVKPGVCDVFRMTVVMMMVLMMVTLMTMVMIVMMIMMMMVTCIMEMTSCVPSCPRGAKKTRKRNFSKLPSGSETLNPSVRDLSDGSAAGH